MSSHRSHHPDNTKTWLPFQFEVAPSDPYESKQKIMIQIQRNVQNLGREPLIPVFMFKVNYFLFFHHFESYFKTWHPLCYAVWTMEYGLELRAVRHFLEGSNA